MDKARPIRYTTLSKNIEGRVSLLFLLGKTSLALARRPLFPLKYNSETARYRYFSIR
jgi:hypothetical protein